MAMSSLSRSATIKGGAQVPMFTVPTVLPQTLVTKTDQEGAEARGLVHLAAERRPSTPNPDRHRHHVVLLIGTSYIHIIPRL
jgi:hypothetical protein